MVVVEILNHVRCRITGLQKAQLKELDLALAMPKEGVFARGGGRRKRGPWDDGLRHFLVKSKVHKARATFPLGLLERARDYLATELRVSFKVKDKRTKAPPVDWDVVRPDMLDGVSFTKEYSFQFDVLRTALQKQKGILHLATNAGKTEIACAIIKAIPDVAALIVCSKTQVAKQTRKRLAERLGTVEEEIGYIGGGIFAPKLITVAVVNSVAPRKGATVRNRILREYLNELSIVFLDEGHHARSTTWYTFCSQLTRVPYQYLLSGTPFGSGNALMVEAAMGPVIARVKNEELVELGVSARPIVHMVEVAQALNFKPETPWHEVYEQGIVYNEERNDYVVRYARRFMHEKMPTLILVQRIAQGNALTAKLNECGVYAEFVHGKTPPEWIDDAKERFASRTDMVLVASSIFDEGVDIPDMRALIVADGGKSFRAVLQKIGRGIRRKKNAANVVHVVDFADLGDEWLARHSLERMDIYEGENFEVHEEQASGISTIDLEGATAQGGADTVRAVLRKAHGSTAPHAGASATAVRGSDQERALALFESSARLHWRRRASC